MIQNLDNEVWMIHPTYTDYAASNYGRIKSVERDVYKKDGSFHQHLQEKLIEPSPIYGGYLQFNICKNGKILDQPLVHRFVYECLNQCLLPKDRKKYQINHISEIKTENFIENLSLCTAKENINYGTHNERVALAQSKRVGQYTLDGNLVKIWKSTAECGRHCYSQGNVASCCRGERKTHKGYVWKYIE